MTKFTERVKDKNTKEIKGWENMNQYLNKNKNNNNKLDKSPENFQINMNIINNLGNINMQRITRRAKTRRNQKCRTRKS